MNVSLVTDNSVKSLSPIPSLPATRLCFCLNVLVFSLSSNKQHLSNSDCVEDKGEVIRTVPCYILYNSCAPWYVQMYGQFLQLTVKKASHTRYWALGPELILVYSQSARRWLSWIASFSLRLPSQPQSITTPWPVPSYTAWWQRHIGVNNLPKVVMQLLPQVEFEPTTCWSQVQRSTHCATQLTVGLDLPVNPVISCK